MAETGDFASGGGSGRFSGSLPCWAMSLGLAPLYLRSVVIRDAAVTTWIDDVNSPIRGYVDKNPLHAGDRVGADGRIATVENPIEDATPVARAEAEVERAKQPSAASRSCCRGDGDAAVRSRRDEPANVKARDGSEMLRTGIPDLLAPLSGEDRSATRSNRVLGGQCRRLSGGSHRVRFRDGPAASSLSRSC